MIRWSSSVHEKDIRLENNLNLLCSGINGTSPTRTVLTAGWVVKEQQPKIVPVVSLARLLELFYVLSGKTQVLTFKIM